MNAMTQVSLKYYCTYRNSDTNRQWKASKRYPSIELLLKAMTPYLAKNPNTEVTYQTEKVLTKVEEAQP